MRWQKLIAAHTRASALYRMVSEAAAAGSTVDEALEEQADKALEEVAKLERLALSMPADDATSFRFKLSLWSDGRLEGFDKEWKTFAADCERLLLEANETRRRA